jgi:hypothetical protein
VGFSFQLSAFSCQLPVASVLAFASRSGRQSGGPSRLVSSLRSSLAFGRCGISPGGVARHSDVPNMLAPRALLVGRIAALGAQRTSETRHLVSRIQSPGLGGSRRALNQSRERAVGRQAPGRTESEATTDNCKLATGSWELEAGNRELGTDWNWEPGTGNWELTGTGNRELECPKSIRDWPLADS